MPGDIGYSQLQIRNNPKTKKKTLAWMTGFFKVKFWMQTLFEIEINWKIRSWYSNLRIRFNIIK